MYDCRTIETEDRYRLNYARGLNSLKVLVLPTRPFTLRVDCAADLKDLWHRFRVYPYAQRPADGTSTEPGRAPYPAPAEWCDSITRIYGKGWEMLGRRLFVCPSAGEGKSHYAMNPKCRSDSLPDTVLLFETRPGWNQHGGPELFTFDNHDPKGGLVLLNDGTVKFIRTEVELKQLRWK